jgi:hypothetical protein
MKLKDKIFIAKAKSLIKDANKRGIITECESLGCRLIHIYVYKNRAAVHGDNNSCLEIK